MKTVLILADDKNFQSLLCQKLQAISFHAIAVEDGLIGLVIARMLFFNLIICDVNMPKMNGFEFLKMLRQESPAKDIPFIMLSTHADYQYRELAFELGANAYLIKPIMLEILLAIVVELSISQDSELN